MRRVLNGTDFYVDLLKQAGGWYLCPKDKAGKRLGPLVGYTKRDEQGRQMVGDVYVNFATVEQHPNLMLPFAEKLAVGIVEQMGKPDWVCGPEWGGVALSTLVACELGCQLVHVQKRLVGEVMGNRPLEELVLSRHTIPEGTWGVCVEDVTNNRSTPDKLAPILEACGAELWGLATAYNRSPHDAWFETGSDGRQHIYPIVSAIHIEQGQFEQDDLAVIADIKAGNWVPKAKKPDAWARLMEAMAKYGS